MVSERGARMSKYLLDKFLYSVDRDPELVERYRADPRGTVEWWETERANVIINLPTHGYTPGVITAVGEALKPLVDARSHR